MIRTVTAALIAGLLLAPAVEAATAKKPAAKPAPAPATVQAPAAKPAAPKTPAPVADFDARNPLSVVAILNLSGGKATLANKEEDGVLVTFTSTAANFAIQFAGCDGQGRACKAAQFDSVVEQPGPAFAQLNAFNQTSALCRGYEDTAAAVGSSWRSARRRC